MEENITGKRIHQLRKEKGITLEDLGKKCGATKGMICAYENGKNKNIPRARIVSIANALDIHPGYLFGIMDYEEAKLTHSMFVAQKEIERECVNELLVEVSYLTDEQVKALTVIVKGMRK